MICIMGLDERHIMKEYRLMAILQSDVRIAAGLFQTS